MFDFITQHQSWAAVLIYWIFSAAVSSMPAPAANNGAGYLWLYRFSVGVATGIVMEFQFGTNWAVYSRFVGDVFGSALAAEGIFAFFLESGFLAIVVFGWHKVSPMFHFFATVMVAVGSIFSAVWIIIANSWQQTPTGHHIVQM